jgi:hypothetical protein
MKFPSPGFLLLSFTRVVRQFPSTMLVAMLGVSALMIMLERPSNLDTLTRTSMVCLLGLPLMTGLTIFALSKLWDEKRRLLFQGIGLVFLCGYWYVLDPKATDFEYSALPGFITLVLVAHLFVSVAPFLNNRPIRDFWAYNKVLFENLVVGGTFTMILFAGLALAILAVDQLFDIGIDEKIYPRLFFILVGIFNTAYFLYHLPKNFEQKAERSYYSPLFVQLCKFILIPVVGLYFLILYAYSIKIIGAWTLPRGWVGSLVTGFSVAGIFTYLLSYYLPEQDPSPQAKAFRRWFWWVLLPMTALLFVAVGRRVEDYGMTEKRYLVAYLGVWLTLNGVYFLVSKKDNIKFIPISLAFFALTWAFGPMSARAVAERSQLDRLTHILQQTGRWENGQMKPGTAAVTNMEFSDFSSAIDFLDSRNRSIVLQTMLPMPVDSLPEAAGNNRLSGRLCAWLGMDQAPDIIAAAKEITVSAATPVSMQAIKGYSFFLPLSLQKKAAESSVKSGYYFQLSDDGKAIEWWTGGGQKDGNLVDKFDLQATMQHWYDQRKPDNSTVELSAAGQVVNFDGKKGKIRILVENSSVIMGDTGMSMDYLNGYIFVQ